MAKTIKELAFETYPVKIVKSCDPLPGGGISEKDENLLERIAMEKGANAVLEEVDNICFQADKTYEERYLLIADLVKHLKGE